MPTITLFRTVPVINDIQSQIFPYHPPTSPLAPHRLWAPVRTSFPTGLPLRNRITSRRLPPPPPLEVTFSFSSSAASSSYVYPLLHLSFVHLRVGGIDAYLFVPVSAERCC